MNNSIDVLLIEDSVEDCIMLKNVCNHYADISIHVYNEPTLQSALQLLKIRTFDLILSDLNLPDSKGVKTIAAIHKASPDVPLVVVSSNDDINLIRECVEFGAHTFIHKSEMNGNLSRAIITAKVKQDILKQKQTTLLNAFRTAFSTETQTQQTI